MNRLINALTADFLAQRDRWLLWLPAPVGLGILAYFSLRAEPPLYLGLAALAALGVLAGAFADRRTAWFWLPFFLVALGFTAAQWRTWSVAAPVLLKETYPVTLEGRVAAVDPMPKSYRIVLEDMTVTRGKIWQDALPYRARIRLKPNDLAEPNAGDIVSIHAVLLPVNPPVLPGAFDFQRFAYFQQLGATGYALSDLVVEKPSREGFIFPRLRRYIREHIEKDIDDRDDAALVTAFVVGDSKRIPESVWDICRRSGIAHLIAISGSHFVLIAGLPFFLVRAFLAAFPFIALRWPVKKIAAGAGICFALFYMMLIGAPIPAQRAALSVCVVMAAVMLDRDPLTLRLAALSAFVILLLEPESLAGASFELSFAAITGLIAFYEVTGGWWAPRLRHENPLRRWCFWLIACVATTMVASLSTGAFALYHFARMPLLAGLAANAVAVPLSSFVTFPAGLIACVLMPLGLEKWPLWVMQKSIDVIMAVAGGVVDWPLAAWEGGAVPASFLGLVTLGGLWICFWKGRLRLFGVLPVVLAFALLPFVPRPDVLVSGDAKLFAVRGADGALWFSTARRDKFERGEWLQLEGAPAYRIWPEDGAAGDFLSCDAASCLYRAKGHAAAFVWKAEAMAEACGKADIVFSPLRLKDEECRDGGKLRDSWDIRQDGAAAVYFTPEGAPRIETVRAARGDRPWTVLRMRRAEKKR